MANKSDQPKSPFRLQSKIKHYQKSYFLHYINKEAPEVSDELKKLAPKCVKLFGDFPLTIHTQNDYQELGVWISIPNEQLHLRNHINTVLRECVWKESRNLNGRAYWLNFLRGNDKDLNQILEIEEDTRKEALEFVESLNEEQLESLKNFARSISTSSVDSLSLQQLKSAFLKFREEFLRQNNDDYIRLINTKDLSIDSLIEFQTDFDSVLSKFRLEKEWLAESVFWAIWNGTGKLQIESSYMEEIPKEITLEIEEKLGISREFLVLPQKNETIEISPLWEGRIPPPKPFTPEEEYWIYSPFEEYEEKAVKAYRQHLQNYFDVIKESFKKHEYKKHQGRQRDFERLEGLVFYIVKNWTAQKVTENFNIELSTFWDAIREFGKYDLPTKKKSHSTENSPSK
jgi:hypothetical protein